MTVLITLTIAGADSGPFDLYSNLDGYVSAFETGVPKASLLAGYSSSLVPDFTLTIRVKSTGDCNNYIDIPLYGTTTTSTSSSSTSSTTTTSTTIANTCYAFESDPYTTTFTAQYIDCDGVLVTDFVPQTFTSYICAQTMPVSINCNVAPFPYTLSSTPFNCVNGVCGPPYHALVMRLLYLVY